MTEAPADIADLILRLRADRPDDPEFWAADAPQWARDPINDDMTSQCGYCGSWMEVVRPGKCQCPACGSDGDKAARWEAAAVMERQASELRAAEATLAVVEPAAESFHRRLIAAEAALAEAREALKLLTDRLYLETERGIGWRLGEPGQGDDNETLIARARQASEPT